MAIWDDIESLERNLAGRLGIYKDYATMLLLNNNWDVDFITKEWNREGSNMKHKIHKDCLFLYDTLLCAKCSTRKRCKTYGCRKHFCCPACVKVHVEREISVGNLQPTCAVDDCDHKLCSSVFLTDISQSSRNLYKLGVFFSYQSSKPSIPQPSTLNSSEPKPDAPITLDSELPTIQPVGFSLKGKIIVIISLALFMLRFLTSGSFTGKFELSLHL